MGDVISFPLPYVHRAWRRCRNCRANVTVYLLGGAECARDPYYTCALCLEAPAAFPERLPKLVNELEAPQLELLEGSPSERTETLEDQLNAENERAGTRPAPWRKPLARYGEPIEAGGRPQPKGGR